jgi:zinc and cadmium transporter
MLPQFDYRTVFAMSAALLLTLYCAMIVLASLSGGWIPMLVRITHTRMQVALSFVAGVMLGVGLLHMIPHSLYELGRIDTTVMWVLVGFLVMFFLERFFHFHHHDAPDDAEVDAHEGCQHAEPMGAVHSHGHGHSHGHDHGHDHDGQTSAFSWGGAFVGLALHSAIDGVALAAAVAVESRDGMVPLMAGVGTFLAVFLHKPFDSLSISTLMAAGGWSSRARHLVNAAYAAMMPLGVLVFILGFDTASQVFHGFLGRALGFAGGAFLCIATSDLLPELQFHRHDRTKLSISLLMGVALAWAILFFETHGHDHLESGANGNGATNPHSHGHSHD